MTRHSSRLQSHRWRLLPAIIVIVVSASVGFPDVMDTLFLRDGSVVKGVVVPGADNTMVIDGNYGFLTVAGRDVLYRMKPGESEPVVSEVYVFGMPGNAALATVVRPVPAGETGQTTFSLLVSGQVTDVRDAAEEPVPYEKEYAGSATRVIVKYADMHNSTSSLNLTSRVDDVLDPATSATVEFSRSYQLERDGRARVILKYPSEWKLEAVSPDAVLRSDGLLVWDAELRRQERFTPKAVLQRQ